MFLGGDWTAAVVIRLFSGWSYVSSRLYAEVVAYEESGASRHATLDVLPWGHRCTMLDFDRLTAGSDDHSLGSFMY